MVKMAVVKTGGKQYLVQEGDEIIVDRLEAVEKADVDLETLATFEGEAVNLGAPSLTDKTKATVVAQVKGDKIRVAKFKAKVRYRRVQGFRPQLTKLKITKI